MKTIYGIALDIANNMGETYVPLQNTTLNEKYSVGTRQPTKNPLLKYFNIGVKVSNTQLQVNNTFKLNRFKHTPFDGVLTKPLPFRMVPISKRLTTVEASQYVLEVIEIYDGVQYYCYYVKTFDSSTDIRYIEAELKDGKTEINLMIKNNTAVLQPHEGRDLSAFNLHEGNYIAVSKPITMQLTPVELTNIEEAFTIIYPAEQKVIGEIGLVSGDLHTTTEAYKACNCLQINTFLEVDIDVVENKEHGIAKIIEIGGMELMSKSGL